MMTIGGNIYRKKKKNYNCTVIFGIDGIGGKAQWDFIVFKYNENQVEVAKKISEELGFKSFQVKKQAVF